MGDICVSSKMHRRAFLAFEKAPAALPRKDSNLERENQNLLCYHYTTG